MNNNNMNFDPMTGQPINQNNNNINQINQGNIQMPNMQAVNTNQKANIMPNVTNNTNMNSQNNMISNVPPQVISAPLVEQSKEQFINNAQVNPNNQEAGKEKRSGINYLFVIILLATLFIAIFFLFPFLSKNL